MAKAENQPSLTKYVLIAVVGLIAALAVIAMLLNMGVRRETGEQMQKLLAENYLDQYANTIDTQIKRIQARVEHLAMTPDLEQTLQQADPVVISAQEQLFLRAFPEATRLKLIPIGKADFGAEQQAGKGFADSDMVRRAEKGIAVTPEFRDGQVHVVNAVRANENSPIRGVVLVSLKDDLIRKSLQIFDAGAGQVTLTQQFKDVGGVARKVMSYGQSGAPELTPDERRLANANWVVAFHPSSRLMEYELVQPATLGIPVGVGGLIALLALGFSFARIRSQFSSDLASRVSAIAENLSAPESAATPQPAASAAPSSGGDSPEAAGTAPESTAELDEEAPMALPPEVEGEEDESPVFQDVAIFDDILEEEELTEATDATATPSAPAEAPVAQPAAAAPGAAAQAAPTQAAAPREMPASTPPESIFRAYDIRGVVGEELTEDVAYQIGAAVGSEAGSRGERTVAIGRDVRLSSPMLSKALARGLAGSGVNVVDLGVVTTPMLYFATQTTKATSGVMITGSHNPPNYNGFKIVMQGIALADQEITALWERIAVGNLTEGAGSIQEMDISRPYLSRICEDIQLARPLKVVIDCGNGVAGVIAPILFESISCEVIPLYCEPDGNFPNHHPDPSKEENLKDLIAKVKSERADIGLAFDGDADRVGVVTNAGTMIWPDRLMMLFAKDIVTRNPGADVIFDVKCSRHLGRLISNYGGRPTMWKTGHSLVKAKMRETGALLGGEMSGHIFLKERWYGFDDGVYAGARLVELLSLEDADSEQIFAEFPNSICTPEINIAVPDNEKFTLIERLCQDGDFGSGKVSTIDGARVDFPEGWGLVRASNTTPNLVLRFEANSQEELERIQQMFRDQLLAADPNLKINF